MSFYKSSMTSYVLMFLTSLVLTWSLWVFVPNLAPYFDGLQSISLKSLLYWLEGLSEGLMLQVVLQFIGVVYIRAVGIKPINPSLSEESNLVSPDLLGKWGGKNWVSCWLGALNFFTILFLRDLSSKENISSKVIEIQMYMYMFFLILFVFSFVLLGYPKIHFSFNQQYFKSKVKHFVIALVVAIVLLVFLIVPLQFKKTMGISSILGTATILLFFLSFLNMKNRKISGLILLFLPILFAINTQYYLLNDISFESSIILHVIVMVSTLLCATIAWSLDNYSSAKDIINLAEATLTLEKESIRQAQELESARQLQKSMLPQKKPTLPNLDIAWYMETATEVGGDYYDYIQDNEDHITLTLGDATGHGMQAGTVVTASKSLFQSMGNNRNMPETFRIMSRSLKNMNFPHLGMAMTFARITKESIQLTSAGMPPILFYKKKAGVVEEILLEGFPLGMGSKTDYEEKVFEFSKGDTILLMSDGLPERMNSQDEYLDYDRILLGFQKCAEEAPNEIIKIMIELGNSWADGREQDDDVSLVVVRSV